MIHHLLKLSTAGLTAIFGVNGAPLLVDSTGAGLRSAWPVNPWLKPRGNALTIYLAKPSAAPSVIIPPPDLPEVDVHAQLFTVAPNLPTNEIDRMLATFDRTAADPTPLPVNRAIAFDITAPPPTELWKDAEPIKELANADRDQLRMLVQKHADAIQARNLDDLSALLEYRTKDCALANGQEPEHMREVIRRQYTQEMFSQPSLQIDGALADKLTFRLIAGGQVVWMYQSLAKPALVVNSPTTQFTLQIYAAKIRGIWRIVR